jgi:hypothetical protein
MVDRARRAAAKHSAPQSDAAQRVGWRVEKSRQRYQHLNNRGALMLVDENNIVIAGRDYDLTPEEVVQIASATSGKRA